MVNTDSMFRTVTALVSPSVLAVKALKDLFSIPSLVVSSGYTSLTSLVTTRTVTNLSTAIVVAVSDR